MAGKGDTQRPRQISAEEFDHRWNVAFGARPCKVALYGPDPSLDCYCVQEEGHAGEHVCGCGTAWSNLGDPR
jgi:hypothetical protein